MSNLRQLKVTFDSFDDLVESIGPGLSRTHLVAPTDREFATDTRVRLEIGTVRKGALIRGVAKVAGPAECSVGTEGMPRSSPSGGTLQSGLHLHLIHLDPSSTRLVDSIVRGEIAGVEAAEKSGPSPFDISSAEPEPPEAPEPLEDPEPPEDPEPSSPWGQAGESEPQAPMAAAPDSSEPDAGRSGGVRRFAWPLALLALAVVFLLALKLLTGRGDHPLLTGRDRQTEIAEPAQTPPVAVPDEVTVLRASDRAVLRASDRAEPPIPTLVESEETAESEPAGDGDPIDPEAPDPLPTELEAATEQVEDVVHAWAEAWSRQDPAAYIALYAADYRPPSLERDTWERQRRERITAPEQLQVSVSELEVEIAEIEIAGPERASASFHQLYTTGDEALAARKILELERFETGWKIIAERVER